MSYELKSSKLHTPRPRLVIGFVLDDGLDRPDGVQQNILTLGNWLRTQGHEVHYLVGETKRNKDVPNIHSMAKNVRVSFNGNKFTIPTYASKHDIKKVLRSNRFDVLHVQMPYHPFCAARIVNAASSEKVVVGTFHILEYSLLTKYCTLLLGWYLQKNLRRFDKYLSVSEPARQFAKQAFRIDCEVLPNPIETARFRPVKPIKRSPGHLRLIFVGRLVKRKGCHKLLEAISLIKQQSRAGKVDFHLDICGDGPLRSQLEEYSRSRRLDDVVSFHGFVSESKKIKLLQRADIAVYPSLAGESFGIVLIEAMAAGTGVVLGGDNPGYHSVLGELPESLFDPTNTPNMASKIQAYIDSASKRSALHDKQQALVGSFDVEVVGRQLMDVYNDCIAHKNSR